MLHFRLSYLVKVLVFAGVYFVAGRVGLALHFEHSTSSPVWPPAGIALAALWLFGPELWPGIALGVGLLSLSTGLPLLPSLGIAAGNTLEAYLAVRLLRHWHVEGCFLNRARDVFTWILMAGLFSTLVGASIGVSSLWLGQVMGGSRAEEVLLVRWLGDATSNLLLAPLLLAWSQRGSEPWRLARILESIGLGLAVVGVGCLVFGKQAVAQASHYPLEFLPFPVVMWAAVRFGPRGAAGTTFLLAGIAVWQTIHGAGPFQRPLTLDSLMYLDFFVLVSAGTGLLLGAITTERQQAERTLRNQENRFRAMVEKSSDAIVLATEDGTIRYLNPADERILGYPSHERVGGNAFDYLHPDDAARARALFRQLVARKDEAVSGSFRLRHRDGTWRWLECRARNLLEDPSVNAMVANYRDITDQRNAEESQRQAETRYREIIENLVVGFGQSTPEGRILMANPALARILGYASAEELMAGITDIGQEIYVHPEQRTALHRMLNERGAVRDFELECYRKDGSKIWVSLAARPLRDSQGTIRGFESLVQDISARKEAERLLRQTQDELEQRVAERTAELSEANEKLRGEISERCRVADTLRKSEERFRSLGECCPVGIFLADTDGRCLYTNPVCQSIGGFTLTEGLGYGWNRFVHPDDREQVLASWSAAVQAGQSFSREFRFQDAQGQVRLVHVRSAVLLSDQGKVIGHVGTVEDITERRQAERKQAGLLGQLRSVNRELNDFAYIVSHDLKAPVRAIGSLASWLVADYGDRLEQAGKEQIELLANRVKRLNALIDGVLQYSRIGRQRERCVSVDLDQLVADVVEMLAPPPHIRVRILHPLPTVQGEPTRLRQVFQNLLSNAIKFMDKPQGLIFVDWSEEPACWRFGVTDNGPGIERKHCTRVFQIFQTLQPRDQFESTGVGLTIVKRIVELYGGTVGIDSTPGQGSTFWFTLPRRLADSRQADVSELSLPGEPSQTSAAGVG